MIKSIRIQNFQSHADTKIDLSDGVNVIVGETCSGKTAILRALRWVTENRPRGTSFVARLEKKGKTSLPCRVTVETERGVVARIREKGFNGYKLWQTAADGKTVERSFKEIGTSVPEEIRAVLDMQEINTQGQLADFFLMLDPPGQISKYVSSLLGFEVADEFVRLPKAEAKSLAALEAQTVGGLDQTEQEIAALAYLDAVGPLIELASEAEERVRALQAQKDELQALIGETERLQEAVELLEKAQRSLDLTDVDEVVVRFDALLDDYAQMKTILHNLARSEMNVSDQEKQVLELESQLTVAVEGYKASLRDLGVCPYCGSEVTEEHIDEVLVA